MNEETLKTISASPRLSDQVRVRLKEYVIENKLRAGDKLPSEETLGARLGVSRTAVREALSSLEALGLVEARQGSGRVVCDFNFQSILDNLAYGMAFQSYDILHLTEIREALDSFFISQAVQEIHEEEINELSDIVDQMKGMEERGDDISDVDHLFHAILYKAAGNPLAQQLFEITWAVRLNTLVQDHLLKDVPRGSADEHAAILRAVREHNVPEAQELIIKHHKNTERRFIERFKQEAALLQQKEATGETIISSGL
jgi:DNA-binding FadR family transcriptional regulator